MTRQLLSFALLCASVTAHADEVRKYSLLFDGKSVGAQTTTLHADGRRSVDFAYRENGRGPVAHEEIALGADGTLKSYALTGTGTLGGPQNETYAREGAVARWKSDADHGELPVTGPTLYLPVGESSPEVLALATASLLKAKSHRLPAAPSGEFSIEKLAEGAFAAGSKSQHAALYAFIGIDFAPTYIWLTSGKQPHLFAYFVPGWLHVVESGYEGALAALEKRQVEAQGTQLAALARKLAHHVAEPIVIRNARVFDAEHATLGAASDVYVYRGRIAAVYPAGEAAGPVGTTIDAGGRVLMPALFDLHDHEDLWRGVMQIAAGVTTGRDMANDNAVLAAQITLTDAGQTVGPRIVPAGFIEGTSENHASGGFLAANLDDVKKAIDWYAQRGYPQIKLYNSFHPEWVPETTKYAHQRGLRVSGHVPAFMRAHEVVEQGFDEIQHMNQVFLNFLSPPGFDSRTTTRFYLIAEKAHELDLDSKPVKQFVALLKEHQTVIDSTLTTFEFLTWKPGTLRTGFEPVADHLPAAVRRSLYTNSFNVTDENAARYQASYDKMVEFAGRLFRAGVPLVAGTDDIAGFALQRELELYVKAGIPAPEVLKIATWNGATYTRTLDRLGSVTRGKLADLILVDGDPTTNISDLRKIGLVMKEGTIYYPSEVWPAVGVKPFTDAVKYVEK